MANQILINGEPRFTVVNYPVDIEPSILSKKFYISGINRDSIRLTIEANINDALTVFTNNAVWGIREYDVDPETGNVLETYNDYDYSEYCIASDIIDHRDGSLTIYMAKKTEEEIQMEQLQENNETLAILLGEVTK